MTEPPHNVDPPESENFTRDQRRRILRMLDDHEKSRHFWRTIGIWFKWFGAVLAILIAIRTVVADLFKGIMK